MTTRGSLSSFSSAPDRQPGAGLAASRLRHRSRHPARSGRHAWVHVAQCAQVQLLGPTLIGVETAKEQHHVSAKSSASGAVNGLRARNLENRAPARPQCTNWNSNESARGRRGGNPRVKIACAAWSRHQENVGRVRCQYSRMRPGGRPKIKLAGSAFEWRGRDGRSGRRAFPGWMRRSPCGLPGCQPGRPTCKRADVETLEYAVDAQFIAGQQGIGALPDFLSGILVQQVFDSK